MLFKKLPDFCLQMYHKDEIRKISNADFTSKYVVLIFYPYDFTYVCPTEINAFSENLESFQKLGADIFLISCDSVYVHKAWTKVDVKDSGIKGVKLPLISDLKRELTKHFGLLNEEENVCHRATVILDDKRNVKHYSIYEDRIGRNVDETMRVVQNMKLLDDNQGRLFCPINFKNDKIKEDKS